MNCPNCKAPSASMSVVRSGAVGSLPFFVECRCGWTQTPLAELVADAAVYTWHRQNPPTKADIEASMNRVSYDLYWDDCSSVAGWMIFQVGFSGRSLADPRIWPKSERAAAEAALAEFVREKEAA